jgi:DNA-binding SARP family transcriptional activator
MTDARLDFRVLGPFEVVGDHGPLAIAGARERAVLAYLLLQANRTVPAGTILDEIWGDGVPESGRKSLQVRVAGLRRVLGGHRIVSSGAGYSVRIEREELDLHRFEDLLGDGHPDSLRRALQLWRGSPLADFADEPWARAPTARLEELQLLALERRIDADLAAGGHREVIPELESLVEQHPLREAFVRQLMLALYRSGRQADALAAYRASRDRLVEELGLDPAPALQQLEQAILRHDRQLEHIPAHVSARSILVASLDPQRYDHLLALAEPLARTPARELVVTQLIDSPGELEAASSVARERREHLAGRGITARAAALTAQRPAADLVRIANEQDVDLLLVDAPDQLLDDDLLQGVLVSAPCDVAVLAARRELYKPGALLVPFTGAEHDWSAIELAAWLARSDGVPLRIAGPVEGERDASPLLASASLAVQRALAVHVEPLLVEPGAEALLAAAEEAELVVVGLSERWRREGLGVVRQALVSAARPPALVVRRGLRPGALAPPEARTRFTWSIGVR